MEKPLGISPSQTVGPFFHYGLTPGEAGYAAPDTLTRSAVSQGHAGLRISLAGRVLDGQGAPVPDAMIELWQADSDGRYDHVLPNPVRGSNSFRGLARTATSAEGLYRFETLKPGPVRDEIGIQAPHLALTVFARGLLIHLFTRAYFADEPANASDPVLALVPEARRSTLIARVESPGQYRHDIRLQGEDETVFFAL